MIKKILKLAKYFSCFFVFEILYHFRILHFLKKKTTPQKYMKLLRFLNPFKISSPGRIILEEKIMPHFLPPSGEKVLIVGFQSYNLHYPFFYLQNPVVISDAEPKTKKLILLGESIIGKFEEFPFKEYFEKFSLIHFNGMYGWGIDNQDDMIRAAKIIYSLLKPGGVLIFGHNIFDHNPLEMEKRYQEYFSRLIEIKNKLFPIVRPDINQVFRVFKKT